MLKLKLQYFGHLMRRTDSLENTLMLHGILQARILEWIAMSSSRGSSRSRDRTSISFIAEFFAAEAAGKPQLNSSQV